MVAKNQQLIIDTILAIDGGACTLDAIVAVLNAKQHKYGSGETLRDEVSSVLAQLASLEVLLVIPGVNSGDPDEYNLAATVETLSPLQHEFSKALGQSTCRCCNRLSTNW